MMEQPEKILIVDDDRNICELLLLYLSREGYLLSFAYDGSAALDQFRNWQPDLVLLDLMLPVISGQDVCRMIRAESDVPIIMLTARDSSDDIVAGLDLGADDYIVKPFDPNEVAARIRARLRTARPQPGSAGKLVIDNLTIDQEHFEVRLDGSPVELTPKELQLLHHLANNRNLVLTRDKLLQEVWGFDYAGETRTVDMHIKKLREKLKSPRSRWKIKTIYGLGYKFEVKP
jgi:DNA-binding response OmpR family regulator